MKKSNLYINFIRFFYDIAGDLDEYSLAELQHFGNSMYLVNQVVLLACWICSLLGYALPVYLLISFTILLNSILQFRLIRRLGLDKLEIESDQLGETKKTMIKRSLWQTLCFSPVALLALFTLWLLQDPQARLSHQEFFFHFSPLALIAAFLFLFLLFVTRNLRRIVIIDEEELDTKLPTAPNWLMPIYISLRCLVMPLFISLFFQKAGTMIPVILAFSLFIMVSLIALLDKYYGLNKGLWSRLSLKEGQSMMILITFGMGLFGTYRIFTVTDPVQFWIAIISTIICFFLTIMLIWGLFYIDKFDKK